MPATPVQSLVRSILGGDVNMPADEVIRRARTKGATAPDESIRGAVYNVKGELRKAAAKAGAKPASSKPVPAAARATKTPDPVPAVVVVPEAVAAVATSSGPDLSAVLANVALVNAVVGGCGGAEPARKVAEAVRACGSVEAFLQHLDLVAGIRGGASA